MMEPKITSMTPADRLYAYNQSNQLEGQTGCIGHLRGDFGSGQEFYTSWFDHRSEYKTDEFKSELDEVVNALGRQIRKNKCKLEKKIRAVGAIDEFLAQETEEASAEEEAEGDYKIERIKHFALKPLLVEEAILQMNMIGHQFFMFQNMETGDVNVVYVRKDGTYGLLEPAEE